MQKKGKALIGALGLGLTLLGGNVMAKETLTIGTDLTYPPYNYLDGKAAAGFDAEFMRMVAKEMGEEARFADTRFANLIMGVNLRKFDVIASTLYVTPERAKHHAIKVSAIPGHPSYQQQADTVSIDSNGALAVAVPCTQRKELCLCK